MSLRKPLAPFRPLPAMGRRLSAPVRSIASAYRGFFQASSHSAARLATPRDRATQDAPKPTSATQHLLLTTSTRASWIPDFASHATFASRWSGDRAFHDARFASAGSSALFRGGRFLPQVFHEPRNRTSGTSVASPFRMIGAFARSHRHQGRRDRIHRASVKITRCPQPEVPSISR
jgi:hypothetical protein